MKKLIAALGISLVTVASACGDDTTPAAGGETPDGSASGTSTGATGSSGTSGATGSSGTTGATGSGSGTTGASGATGTTGTTGTAGTSGTTGTTGGTGASTGTSGTTSGTSGSTTASCNAAFTPCGGDVTGTWKIADECIAFSAEADAGCAGETGSVTLQSGSETLTFNAGAYTVSSAQITAAETVTIPIACLSVDGIDAGSFCDEYGTILSQGGGTVNCTLSAASCTCSGTTMSSSDGTSGTYTLSGNMVTINPADGGASTPANYCVQGNTLYVDASATGSAMGGSFIVLTKQ